MRKYFPIYEETVSHIWLCNCSILNILIYEENLIFLFYQSNPRNLWVFNPILHIAWLDNHALTLKSNSAKYYFNKKSRFLHTFLKFCCESRKI
jgi:hypothetical protein